MALEWEQVCSGFVEYGQADVSACVDAIRFTWQFSCSVGGSSGTFEGLGSGQMSYAPGGEPCEWFEPQWEGNGGVITGMSWAGFAPSAGSAPVMSSSDAVEVGWLIVAAWAAAFAVKFIARAVWVR